MMKISELLSALRSEEVDFTKEPYKSIVKDHTKELREKLNEVLLKKLEDEIKKIQK